TPRHDCRTIRGIMPRWSTLVRDRSPGRLRRRCLDGPRAGPPARRAPRSGHLGFSMGEVQALVINPRLRHRRARGERLSAEESDRGIRLGRTLSLTERTFGDRDRAWRWLRKANRSLGGHRPLDLLATETGARAVEESLIRLDEGMFV